MDLTKGKNKVGLVAVGLVAGGVLAGAYAAQAATPAPSPGASPGSTAADPHPGDNGADGIPESQESHGGRHGGALDLSGTVTAVGPSSVTIKSSGGTTEYAVSGDSDVDKNGEGQLSDLAAGDAVTFSLDPTGKTIDKLHAGDETRNRPTEGSGTSTSGYGA